MIINLLIYSIEGHLLYQPYLQGSYKMEDLIDQSDKLNTHQYSHKLDILQSIKYKFHLNFRNSQVGIYIIFKNSKFYLNLKYSQCINFFLYQCKFSKKYGKINIKLLQYQSITQDIYKLFELKLFLNSHHNKYISYLQGQCILDSIYYKAQLFH